MIGVRVGGKVGTHPGDAIGLSEDEDVEVETTSLTVAIADSADPVIVLLNFNYTVVVTNTGTITALGVAATVRLDSRVTFVSGSGTGWTVVNVGGVVTCTRATLVAGAAPTITITVSAPIGIGTMSTSADAGASNAVPASQDIETTAIVLS